MFKRRLCSKTKTTVGTSERRALIKNVLEKFPMLTHDVLDDYLKPRDKVCKMEAVGENQVKVTVYLINTTPIFFEDKSSKVLFPTVFTLWKFPDLLPVVTTWVQVWPKIENGADLMGPGIISRECREGHGVGSLMALNLSNNRAIVAVGEILASEEEMAQTNNRRKYLKIIHRYNDALANLCKDPLPQLEPPECASDSKPEPADLEEEPAETSDEVELSERLDEVHISPSEQMDQLLKYCLLKVIKTKLSEITFPFLVSTFYKNYLLAATPSSQEIDLKKSSYKKLGKFLQTMEENKLVTLTETKNILSITKFNTSHSDVINFSLNADDVEDHPEDSSQKPASLINYLMMSRKVLYLVTENEYKLNDILTEEQVKNLVIKYVKSHHLARGNKVEPDEALGCVLETCESLPWNQAIEKVKSQMTPYYGTQNVSHPLGMVIMKGKVKSVSLIVQNRKYGKKVTVVSYLDVYGIDINEFAKVCRRSVGSATTIDTDTDPPSLVIQGNQILPIYKLLTETYNLKKHQIRGLEYAPKQPKTADKSKKKTGNVNK